MKGNGKASEDEDMAAEFIRQLRSGPVRLSLSSLPLFKVDGELPDDLGALLDRLSEVEDDIAPEGSDTGAGFRSGRSGRSTN